MFAQKPCHCQKRPQVTKHYLHAKARGMSSFFWSMFQRLHHLIMIGIMIDTTTARRSMNEAT
jgi:hypothetical protein